MLLVEGWVCGLEFLRDVKSIEVVVVEQDAKELKTYAGPVSLLRETDIGVAA